MKINNMVKYNEKKQDISKYVMWAIVSAIICFIILNVLVMFGVIVVKVMIQYWWISLVIIFILIIFRKIGRKKKK